MSVRVLLNQLSIALFFKAIFGTGEVLGFFPTGHCVPDQCCDSVTSGNVERMVHEISPTVA